MAKARMGFTIIIISFKGCNSEVRFFQNSINTLKRLTTIALELNPLFEPQHTIKPVVGYPSIANHMMLLSFPEIAPNVCFSYSST